MDTCTHMYTDLNIYTCIDMHVHICTHACAYIVICSHAHIHIYSAFFLFSHSPTVCSLPSLLMYWHHMSCVSCLDLSSPLTWLQPAAAGFLPLHLKYPTIVVSCRCPWWNQNEHTDRAGGSVCSEGYQTGNKMTKILP